MIYYLDEKTFNYQVKKRKISKISNQYFFQFICKNDAFDEFNRAKIINDYKIDCEQFQINSTFFIEYYLWDRSQINMTWVFEDRKLSLSPNELNRDFDASDLWTIGFELSDELENKTGFNWCTGTQLKPQGIYWSNDQQEFILVDGSSRFNRFEINNFFLLFLGSFYAFQKIR